MRRLASSDRSTLIRLASAMPKGNSTRRAILAGLTRVAIEFDTKEALEKYMKDHPNADPKNHSVKKNEESGNGESGNKDKWEKMNRNQINELANDLDNISYDDVGDFMYTGDIDVENTNEWSQPYQTESYYDAKKELLDPKEGIFSKFYGFNQAQKEENIKKIAPNFVDIDANFRKLFKDPKNLDGFLDGLDKDIESMRKTIKQETGRQYDRDIAAKYNDAVSVLEMLTDNLKTNLKKVIPKYHELNDGVKKWREKNN